MNESLKIIACEIVYACTHVHGRRLYISHKLDDLLLDVGYPRPMLTGLSFQENSAFWEPFICPMKRGQYVSVNENTETAARKYLREECGDPGFRERTEIIQGWTHPKQPDSDSLSPRDKKILEEREKLEEWDRSQR